MAAGIASIDYIRNENLLNHVSSLGEKARAKFAEIAALSEIAGEVRGVGFMIGNEIVESKQKDTLETDRRSNAQRYV